MAVNPFIQADRPRATLQRGAGPFLLRNCLWSIDALTVTRCAKVEPAGPMVLRTTSMAAGQAPQFRKRCGAVCFNRSVDFHTSPPRSCRHTVTLGRSVRVTASPDAEVKLRHLALTGSCSIATVKSLKGAATRQWRRRRVSLRPSPTTFAMMSVRYRLTGPAAFLAGSRSTTFTAPCIARG
jgi:hypothetical protein